MTLTQFQYIIALDDHRQFQDAADHCFVTQPTLSIGVKKLEEELGVTLFNRKSTPLEPTTIGKQVITRARAIIKSANDLSYYVENQKGELKGEFKIGVIPTLAPYVIPLFFSTFRTKYPDIKLIIEENQTHILIEQIEKELIDTAILVTPVKEAGLSTINLYEEPFVGYFSDNHPLLSHKQLTSEDITTKDLWLLNQGHCFREQVLNICDIKRSERDFIYESGSIETLRKMVDQNLGYTLIPFAALNDMEEGKMENVRFFKEPQPTRQVSLIHNPMTIKQNLITLLQNFILEAVHPDLRNQKGQKIPI